MSYIVQSSKDMLSTKYIDFSHHKS